jgi:hypothetical protein
VEFYIVTGLHGPFTCDSAGDLNIPTHDHLPPIIQPGGIDVQKLIDVVLLAMGRGLSVRLTVDKSFFWEHMEIAILPPGLHEEEETATAQDEMPPAPPLTQPSFKDEKLSVPSPTIDSGQHLREFQ